MPTPEYKIGQTVYYANLRMKENGDVIKCEVKPMVVITVYPSYCGRKNSLHYHCANADSPIGRAYKPTALHKSSAEALATLKNKLTARIDKLHAALAKLPQ